MGETGPDQTRYVEDLKTLNSLLKASGVVPGDMVKVTRREDFVPVCGYYAGTGECISVIVSDKKTKQYKLDNGGLDIIISPYFHILQQHSITTPEIQHESVLVRDIKALDKLVVSEKE